MMIDDVCTSLNILLSIIRWGLIETLLIILLGWNPICSQSVAHCQG